MFMMFFSGHGVVQGEHFKLGLNGVRQEKCALINGKLAISRKQKGYY